jgi:predicted RNA binding protein YcfA (HicA-like mRNA interferase family)
MTKFPVCSAKQIIKTLRSIGFEEAPKRGKGSHIAMVKRDRERTRLVIIPKREIIPRGTLRAILEQAGLTREEFLALTSDDK